MHSLFIASTALLSFIVHVPPAAAQTSVFSCYTVPGWGTKSKPWTTFYDARTSIEVQTIQADFTTTITGAVPDSTITVHEKKWRTDYREEYIVCIGSRYLDAAIVHWLNSTLGDVHINSLGDTVRNARTTNYYNNSARQFCDSCQYAVSQPGSPKREARWR